MSPQPQHEPLTSTWSSVAAQATSIYMLQATAQIMNIHPHGLWSQQGPQNPRATAPCPPPPQETLFLYYVLNNIKPMLVSISEYFDTFTDDVKVLQCRKAKFRQNSEGKRVTGYSLLLQVSAP